jgi:hypothetical protein
MNEEAPSQGQKIGRFVSETEAGVSFAFNTILFWNLISWGPLFSGAYRVENKGKSFEAFGLSRSGHW